MLIKVIFAEKYIFINVEHFLVLLEYNRTRNVKIEVIRIGWRKSVDPKMKLVVYKCVVEYEK